MQYRPLGNTGLQVSTLGFGAMRLPTAGDKIDRKKAVAMMHRAFDEGVNYVDSAFFYHGGESEEVVGEALKGYRDRVLVSTKNPYKGPSGEDWMKNLETQLRRLDVDHIDFYLSHGLGWNDYDQTMTAPGGPMEMYEKAREQGKIRYACFSCHDNPDNMIRLIDTGRFATITLQYNLLDRSNERAIAHAHRSGMGVIAMGPVGGGRLVPPSDTIAGLIPGKINSTVEAALRFVLSNEGVSVALSGMSTMEQVEENLVICSRTDPFSEAEKARIVQVLEETKRLADLYCTGCRYCMPCPQNVNIAHCFSLMNLHRVWGLTDYARTAYQNYRRNPGPWDPNARTAEACVECGECEPKCPQNIPIMKQLKEVDKTLG